MNSTRLGAAAAGKIVAAVFVVERRTRWRWMLGQGQG